MQILHDINHTGQKMFDRVNIEFAFFRKDLE